MRISYGHDIGAFLTGSHGLLIERILAEERVGQDRGVFYLDAPASPMPSFGMAALSPGSTTSCLTPAAGCFHAL